MKNDSGKMLVGFIIFIVFWALLGGANWCDEKFFSDPPTAPNDGVVTPSVIAGCAGITMVRFEGSALPFEATVASIRALGYEPLWLDEEIFIPTQCRAFALDRGEKVVFLRRETGPDIMVGGVSMWIMIRQIKKKS